MTVQTVSILQPNKITDLETGAHAEILFLDVEKIFCRSVCVFLFLHDNSNEDQSRNMKSEYNVIIQIMPGLEGDLEEWQTQEVNVTRGEAKGDIDLEGLPFLKATRGPRYYLFCYSRQFYFFMHILIFTGLVLVK